MSQILDDLGSKFLWDIVNKIQKSVQVDVEMILTALMPMLSVVIGNKAKFIGPSGTAMSDEDIRRVCEIIKSV